ncbi:MAG: aminoacyl-histidine dipeptidase [Planctomycetota bacterium]|jgi:dipeptidase D
MNTPSDKTATILEWFAKVNEIPRESKNEEAISTWLSAWAEEHGFTARRDAVMNLVIEVPGSPGYENSPTVVIQGHMDMVCEKAKGSPHDFTKDPIKLVYDGDWLHADQTTLGADNGIALAMAMTIATEPDLKHPPLELLFTVDEETGLTGANALEPGFISGKILLNVDSEDEGVFTVGCAGGRDTHLYLPIEREAVDGDRTAHTVVVSDLRGGHSGIDIQKGRGNALCTLARVLYDMVANHDIRLVTVQGGSAHNAIPRDAEAIVMLPQAAVSPVTSRLAELQAVLRDELANVDPKVSLSIKPTSAVTGDRAWSAASTRRGIELMMAMPHAVEAFSTDIEGLVETSNNFATVATADDEMVILSSQRSSVKGRLDLLTDRIECVGRLAGARAESGAGYPAWEANMDSPLLETCKNLYRELFGKEPVVEVIHAGLECGIIGDKNPGMDMISFGPTIQNPHSPDERIEVPSIGLVWTFLVALLERLE